MVSTDFPWPADWSMSQAEKNRGRAGAHQMGSCGRVYSSKKWNFEKIVLFFCWKLFLGKHVFHTSFHKKSPIPGYIRAGRFYHVKINFARYKHETDFHLYPCCHLEFCRESRLQIFSLLRKEQWKMFFTRWAGRAQTGTWDWVWELGVGRVLEEQPLFPHDAHRSFDKQQNGRPCEDEVGSDFWPP